MASDVVWRKHPVLFCLVHDLDLASDRALEDGVEGVAILEVFLGGVLCRGSLGGVLCRGSLGGVLCRCLDGEVAGSTKMAVFL